MSRLVIVTVTEWNSYGLGKTENYEEVRICEELFRALHVRGGEIYLSDRHSVKNHGQRRNNFRPLVPEDKLVATIEVGANWRVYASKWNFLDQYNRIAKRHGFPPLQVESAQSGEMMVAAG